MAPKADAWHLIFEYELPCERGRRPDIVILAEGTILVIEFKDFSVPLQAHVDQVSAYARDLSHYHAASRGMPVLPILLLTLYRGLDKQLDDVQVGGPDLISKLDDLLPTCDRHRPINPTEWLAADYAPLPSLVEAARTIFENEPLPQIRRAQSAGIADTIRALMDIGDVAQRNNERHLALVTGVPGAGKTLVGLQFVYTYHSKHNREKRSAVFLSGNGPLVKVLQHALKSTVFVQDVHGFLRQYGGNRDRLPEEHIWVYDEAQRAWDSDRVQQKRGHGASEPEDFLRLGERMDSWAMVVGLIGEGQEIHLGEESGLGQWNDAIGSVPSAWKVHSPPHVAHLFIAADEIKENERLDLTVSLRSHLAEDVQTWIAQTLAGDLAAAASTPRTTHDQEFDAYITRDLEVASAYVRERYHDEIDKRYGLLASSKARNLSKWGVENSFAYTRRLKEGPWYNDPPSSRFSCCQLHDVATEFAAQGLELDFPIVAWGDDVWWYGSGWQSRPQPRSTARDPHQLRINSYRVLLSRGRDGFVVFVPREQNSDTTAQALENAGLVNLDVPEAGLITT